MNISIFTPAFASLLGYCHARSGNRADGLSLLGEGTKLAETSCRAHRAHWLSLGSEAALLTGHLDEAHALARRGLEGARTRSERGDEARCLRALGEVEAHGHGPDLDAARTHLGDALALATELGMRPLVARCHLSLGTLLRKASQSDQAREHLTTAVAMLRDMGMTYWLVQAEAELVALA
jgi:tetratricopeptide (TPR) repeat protein